MTKKESLMLILGVPTVGNDVWLCFGALTSKLSVVFDVEHVICPFSRSNTGFQHRRALVQRVDGAHAFLH